MRWFWQRRKKDSSAPVGDGVEVVERTPHATGPRANVRSIPLADGAEPRDALLAFARDVLNAQGARVRVEDDDLVIATFAGAPAARYTSTIARARAEVETTLLTPGAPSLDTLFDEAARHAQLTTLTLAPSADAVDIAMNVASLAHDMCGRCAGGHAIWLAGAPSCDTCPLRRDQLALRWDSPPANGEITSWTTAQSIELTYRIAGRDRRGRHDEWVRLAFDTRTGARLEPLTTAQIASSQATSDAGEMDSGAAESGIRWAQGTLRPGMEALAGYLSQRVGVEYQQRADEVTQTHERLKRERPDEASAIEVALDRELASLADVYGVDVDASLEALCFITTPIAVISLTTEAGGALNLDVDIGRAAIRPPICGACGRPATAGRVCANGHVRCAACVEACGRCDTLRCPDCSVAPFPRCALCHEPTCPSCARVCDTCGETHCADHVWTCVEGDQTLCLRDLTLCEECQAPLCANHTSVCTACTVALCPRHARACKSGGEILCAAHAASCVTCAAPLCAAHAQHCEECWKALCREDTITCLGCGRGVCDCASPAPCASCGASYCARCRDDGASCPACRALTPASEADLGPLRVAANHDPSISLKRAWLTGRNALARVYIGRGLGRDEAYVVSEQGEVITSRRKGWRA